MVISGGLEPPTSGLGNLRSFLLNYETNKKVERDECRPSFQYPGSQG